MKITRRSPRIRIGNTIYTFSKNGVSSSTKIAKGVRLRTDADGHQSIGGNFLFWRWSQDLDIHRERKSHENIDQTHSRQKNGLSFWFLIAHPILFFTYLLHNKSNYLQTKQIKTPQITESSYPSNSLNSQQLQEKNNQKFTGNFQQIQEREEANFFSTKVSVYNDINGTLKKVSKGTVMLKSDRLIVEANVVKEFFYKDIIDIYIEKRKVFLSLKSRKKPLVIETNDVKLLMCELNARITKGC